MFKSGYAPSGAHKLPSTTYNDQTANASWVGLYTGGKLNITILVNENTHVNRYAANGSLNVVQGAGNGVHSKCGAVNVVLS
jgi:hypothetical protein